MGSKRPNVQPPSSSSDDEEASAGEDSSSEEEQQPVSPPPTKKPSPKSPAPKTKPDSKSLQKPTVAADDDEDEDEEEASEDSTIAKKKDLKKKEDEEEEASSEEEEEEEEDAKQQPSKKPDSSAISGSGSDTGSDSDSEPSEKQAVANAEPAAESGKKRQRISAPSEVENSEKRQKLFQRFWGQDDEIKILEAIIAFYSDKGPEPPSNAGAGADLDHIHELLKKSLASSEFTKSQLNTKIRGLKRKFQTNASRETKKAGLKFSKPHDQEVYELSKKIWQPTNPRGAGSVGVHPAKSVGVKPAKSKGKASALNMMKEQDDVSDSDIDACYTYLEEALAWRQRDSGNLSINKGLKLIDPAKARSLEERLRTLEDAKRRHTIKWAHKIEEALQLITDAMKKSKSG